ncbi:MAG: YdiU family protein [Rhizobiaceae bacterium]|nr:YdiU family protein [Rhizobiaceae bacterium]
MTAQIPFDNSYVRLPPSFYVAMSPSHASAPRMLRFNRLLAERLGLDAEGLDTPEGAALLSGATYPEGAEPVALAYAGHQFGHFNPQLGDGRALLLGEIVAPDGARFDLQLKGSGPTPFSRGGDGRAALGPVLREYLVSEAMAALGVPTTRALAMVATGDPVFRDAAVPGAVLTRVASSHIRIGTFQYFAARGDRDALRRLADHAIARHDPEAARAERPIHTFLAGVIARQARLVAQWMAIGFVHGVMNTDNMSISGETIDYGPCAFLDAYDPETVFSSIDRDGRYAYANQPGIAQWNLTRLAECLLPFLAEGTDAAIEEAQGLLAGFAEAFNAAYIAAFRAKLGLVGEDEGDARLVEDLLSRMTVGLADFTLTFRRLCESAVDPAADAEVRALFQDPDSFDAWAMRWRARTPREETSPEDRRAAMRLANPAFIPRNHHVEEAIAAAVEREDFGPLDRLLKVLSHPFDDQPDAQFYAEPAPIGGAPFRTFCGT